MRRRQFVALLGGLAAAPAASVLAQGTQPAQSVSRIGLLGSGPPFGGKSPIVLGLGAAFKAHGYMVGRDVVFVGRAAAGDEKRLPGLVGELTASGVRLIVSLGYPAAVAAKEHTRLAVVAMNTGDPVATRLVESLSRPGGHVTGISDIASELAAKRLQLLTEAVPHVRKVAMLWNADNLGMTFRYKAARAAALRLHIEVQPLGVREPDDFGSAFAAMTKDPPDAILMVTDALTILNHRRVFEFAAAHRLPAIYEFDFLVRDGGLMSYGPDDAETYDRVAGLADRILKGANPADLPFEEPTKFDLAVNLKTAKALGLKIPRAVLARADEVVE